MIFLIFNPDGEMIDALEFNTLKEVDDFKMNNPTLIVEEEGIDDLNEFELEDDQDDYIDNESSEEWF